MFLNLKGNNFEYDGAISYYLEAKIMSAGEGVRAD